ncbi:YhbY family RNA-binding protein [Bermanella sp. R86510]|uniref:YhbY family RNA-binding protein n=1 Tax=unclassified Bermanella TaxID=2627862 RepID=UPI0037CBB8D5
MQLTQERKKALRTIGHNLHPIVTVAGNGLTDSVLLEIDRALEDHELIKVKFSVGDRELKKQLLTETEQKTKSTLIQSIGNIGLFYRPAKEPNLKKSNILRA